MNYRHVYHAGNFADVFKHALLARILVYLTRKDRPLRYIDSHAGIGCYDLRSSEAQRGAEWRDGIGRLPGASWSSEAAVLLDPYLRALGPLPTRGEPESYPGSPVIAQRLLRPQDRLILCEAHPEDYQRLAACVGRDRRAKALEIDGYMALRAYAPPVERRGLALIDPPFETRDELARTRDNLCAAYKKFPTGVYALWRPLKEPPAIDAFDAALVREGIGKMLRLDLTVREIRPGEPLAGSSLLVVNPPFVLEAEARRLLPELSSLLSQGEGAGWRVGWVAA